MVVPAVNKLEDRTVLNGYLAIGAGPGAPPLVAIRIDRIATLTTSPTPIPLGGSGPTAGVTPPASDGQTDTTTQIFLAYDKNFLGGVHIATGNFAGFSDNLRFDPVTGQQITGSDGQTDFPDYLVTAPGEGGGPDVKVWKMRQDINGNIFVDHLVTEFMAYDPRFRGGVSVTTGDLDGDGKAELIVGAGPGGGPHVKIYKFDFSDQQMVLVNQFMAYDPSFRGGVNVGSGQGYRTTTIVQQDLNAPHPMGFTETPYPASQGVPKPGAAEGVPLSGNVLNLTTGMIDGTFTVGSGALSYVGANLLNNYGNLAYTPNVIDPSGRGMVPPEEPLVYATWPATSTNRPAFMPAGVPVGPFIRLPDQGTTPVVKPFTAGPGAVDFRNQLVTGPGQGGGPLVRVWDFINGPGGFQLNARIEFVAGDINSRSGINVAIGTVIDNALDNGTTVTSSRTSPRLANLTFPYNTSVYTEFQPSIIVTPASGGGALRAYADTVQTDGQGRVIQKTSITQLDMRPVNLQTVSVVDPNNPLGPLLPPAGQPSVPGGNFFSTVDTPTFNNAIDPQYRGDILAAVSALLFDGTGATARAQYVVAAGPGQNQPLRGPRVRIFDNLGTLINPTNPSNSFPVLPNTGPGNQDPYSPIDDFIAFTAGSFPGGVGGVAYGFGLLPNPTTDVVTLPPKPAATVSDPIYVPPDPQP
jgi:hypothetical protein